MSRFRLTDPAVEDLDRVLDFFGHHSQKYSSRLRHELRRRFRLLAHHPKLGTPVGHLAPGLRKTSVRDITIYFRNEAGITVVHRILHGARDIDSDFFESDTR